MEIKLGAMRRALKYDQVIIKSGDSSSKDVSVNPGSPVLRHDVCFFDYYLHQQTYGVKCEKAWGVNSLRDRQWKHGQSFLFCFFFSFLPSLRRQLQQWEQHHSSAELRSEPLIISSWRTWPQTIDTSRNVSGFFSYTDTNVYLSDF